MRSPSGRRFSRYLFVTGLLLLAGCSTERLPTSAQDRAPVLIGFISDRPPSATYARDIYLYDVQAGGPAFMPPNLDTPSDDGPGGLSGDGRYLAFFSNRLLVGRLSTLFVYNLATGETHEPISMNRLFYLLNPTLSGDGRYVAAQYQIGEDEYVGVCDLAADTLLPVPNMNEPNSQNFDPSINGDGTLIAFATNGSRSTGAWDIVLYSVPADSFIALPGLNSRYNDLSPSISADGRYIAFQSGRLGGAGVIDVYVYDRVTRSLLPLPGANTDVSDYQPVISPDGRYLAYTTEASGGGDIRLYDILAQRLIPLPGLNDPYYSDQMPTLANRPVAGITARAKLSASRSAR